MKPHVNNIINRYLWAFILGALALGAGVLPARADYKSAVLTDGPAGYWRFSETPVITPAPLVSTNLGTVGTANNGAYIGSFTRGVPGVLSGFARHLFHRRSMGTGAQCGGLESESAFLGRVLDQAQPRSRCVDVSPFFD